MTPKNQAPALHDGKQATPAIVAATIDMVFGGIGTSPLFN